MEPSNSASGSPSTEGQSGTRARTLSNSSRTSAHSQQQLNSAGNAESAPSASPKYGSLSYAPRQRLRPLPSTQQIPTTGTASPTRASSSSSITQVRASASPGSPTAANAPFQQIDTLVAASATGLASGRSTSETMSATARARLRVQEMKGRAQQLGLTPESLGWQMLEKLQSLGGADSEWGKVLDLVGAGQCTLLLPKSSPPASSSGTNVSLATVHDHVLVHALPSRPSPSSLIPSSQATTLSGLRAIYGSGSADRSSPPSLTFKSFIPRPESTFSSELRNERTRSEFLRNLPQLPAAGDSPNAPTGESPYTVKLLDFDDAFSVPPSTQPRKKQAPHRSRPSSTFASLFAGTGRARQLEADRDGVRDNVNASAPAPGEADDEEVVGSERSIAIWVVDQSLHRARIIDKIGKAMQARLTAEMSAAGIDTAISDVVCTFAAMFLPPKPTTRGLGTDGSISPGLPRSPSMPFLATPGSPYLASADDLADNFQSFYSGILEQLDAQLQHTGSSASEQRRKELMQAVETAVCEEVYDRIFSPFSSRDWFLDVTLSSRIAALNLLGLTLSHLGLVFPHKDSAAGRRIHEGLDKVTRACGELLCTLEDPTNQSPAKKLVVLTAAHKCIADALAELPPIKLKDADGAPEPVEAPAAEVETESVADGEEPLSSSTISQGAASADLILPLLIYSIVRANPPNLASHLLFIQRFRADCLLNGETSYCLVNMQAAVAFIENVEPSALGFDGVVAETAPVSGGGAHSRVGSAGAVETLASPTTEQFSISERVRSKLAADFGELAGVSNKAITSVLGTGLTAFGRIMAGAASNQASPSADATPSGGAAGRRSRTQSVAKESDARSIRSVTTTPIKRAGTDYGDAGEVAKERTLGVSPSEPSKASLSERLAAISVLGRMGMADRAPASPSPRSGMRELPAPPPEDAASASRIPASLRSPYAPLQKPPTASRPLHVVLAASGSVASIKVPLIVDALLARANVRVQVVATKAALHFFKPQDLAADGSDDYLVKDLAAENQAAVRGTSDELKKLPRVKLWTDEEEWDQWGKVGDPILHIELRRWADIVLIAPCSADTLAKINAGICDNLLTSFLRALSPTTPIVLCPAMNTLMWLHPLTARHVAFVKNVLGYEVLGPIEKRLACGDMGQGAMFEWSDIVQMVVDRFGLVMQDQEQAQGPQQAAAVQQAAPATQTQA